VHLVLVDAFAARVAGHELILEIRLPVGEQHACVLAEGLRCGEAIKSFGAGIPAGDYAVEGLADDGVVG
jgi:hypothetical protein